MAGATLLVVDDEDGLRHIIARNLAFEGYRVLEAADGLQALAIASREPVDLVVTDVRMPQMDGYELADRLLRINDSLPIVFISGFDQRGIALPGTIFPKPFSMDALVREIRRLLHEAVP